MNMSLVCVYRTSNHPFCSSFSYTVCLPSFSHHFPIMFQSFSHHFPNMFPSFSQHFPIIFPTFSHHVPIIFHHENTIFHLSPSFFCRGQTSRLAPDSLRWFDPPGDEMFVCIYKCVCVILLYQHCMFSDDFIDLPT